MRLNAYQHQQTLINGADGLARDIHARTAHALE
jgi:hypothetical protein